MSNPRPLLYYYVIVQTMKKIRKIRARPEEGGGKDVPYQVGFLSMASLSRSHAFAIISWEVLDSFKLFPILLLFLRTSQGSFIYWPGREIRKKNIFGRNVRPQSSETLPPARHQKSGFSGHFFRKYVFFFQLFWMHVAEWTSTYE